MKRASAIIKQGEFLAHFTRASARESALDNLISILDARAIAPSLRMVRGKTPVVSLFDAPLSELRGVLVRANRRRYEPFGIAIDKRYAFGMGARPVIYLPWNEARALVAPTEHWRVVSIDLERKPPIDWTREREWRAPRAIAIDPTRCIALVESWRDAEVIYDRFAGKPPCAGVIPVGEMFGRSA
jgi:hypothetical protein